MTLFSIARKNVVGHMKNYLLYLISMVFSVVIYYTFVSLQYHPDIQTSMATPYMQEFVGSVFQQASIILILFVAVFIWYSNAFFMKKRKKEVGLYALLGLRKRKIAGMLFYENVMMSAVAIMIGLVLGVLLSKLFAMILLKLLDSAVDVRMTMAWGAIVHTILVFAVIVLVTSFQSYRLIYRFKLIALFQAEKEGEQAPKLSFAVALAGLVLIAFSYWIVFQPIETTEVFIRNLGAFFACLIIGTYFVFRSSTIALLRMARSRKSHYYRGMNMISTSSLLYRIQGNARMLATIALLSAITLAVMSVGYSNYYNTMRQTEQKSPFSYTHLSGGNEIDEEIKQIIRADTAHPLTAELDIPFIEATGDITGVHVDPPSGYEADRIPVQLISESTYNRVADALGREEKADLSGQQAAAVLPLYTHFSPENFVGDPVRFTVSGQAFEATFASLLQNRIMTWRFPDFYMVVSDAAFAEMSALTTPKLYKAYKVEDGRTTKETAHRLAEAGFGEADATATDLGETEAGMELSGTGAETNSSGTDVRTDAAHTSVSTYYAAYRQGIESNGLDIFLMGFLGLVFLAATGSVIYFKQLTEAYADQSRYHILREIGVSRHEIGVTAAKQTAFIFILPFIVGLAHSAMILKAMAAINLIGGSLLIPIMTTMALYTIIYFVYYVLCVNAYVKIVNA